MRIVAITAQTIRWTIASDGAARGRTERAAVLLEARSDRGAIGLGEAAPLPGMSLDTLEQAEAALAGFAGLAPFDVVIRDPAHVSNPTHGSARAVRHMGNATQTPRRLLPFEIVNRDAAQLLDTAPPAARFAIETALCDALARDRGISLTALLVAHADPGRPARAGAPQDQTAPQHVGDTATVPLAAVVDDVENARRAYAAGIRCFKIKLADEDSLDRVLAIARAAPDATLRIDANRSWPRDEVATRLAALAQVPVEYVEEPCRDAHLLLHAAPLPCKLALDESLPALSHDELLAALAGPQLAAVILKPTLLGGLSAALDLARLARRSGVAAVVSHALEGPIGTAACAELARALAKLYPVGEGSPPTARPAICPAAGLAPHTAVASWDIEVEQLGAAHIRAAATPGLGLGSYDLAAIVRSCRTRINHDEARPL